MRTAFLVFAALAALAFAVGGLSATWRPHSQQAATPAVEVTLASSNEAAKPGPVPATGAPSAAATPKSAQPAPAAPPPPAPKDPGADLPVVRVAEPEVHAVPADAELEVAPAISIQPSDGRAVERMAYAPPPPAARAKPRTRAAHAAAVETEPSMPIDGTASAIGGASLSVGGWPVRLFGVRPASAHDRCGTGDASCAEAARTALAQRLAGNADVTCAMPPGQERDPAYVCHDAVGVDLGRMLVVEGLALADTSRSYQYLGDQDGARTTRQGLWRYR